jgi:hypothetical protein
MNINSIHFKIIIGSFILSFLYIILNYIIPLLLSSLYVCINNLILYIKRHTEPPSKRARVENKDYKYNKKDDFTLEPVSSTITPT